MDLHATLNFSGNSSASASTATGGTSTSSVTSSILAISSDAAILQRLIKCGVPSEYLGRGKEGVAEYVKEHRRQIPVVIAALLPGPDEIQAASLSGADEVQGPGTRKEFLNQCRDALKWVQWAMFQGEPQAVLAAAGQGTGSTRGVCGAVWGSNDIAYRCRTCEHDPTCAICVPCFQNGNHATHDYSMIRTGGGCCDCGDVTAWKLSGFCSRHCGPGQVPLLPSSLVEFAAPVLEALLFQWVHTLKAAELVAENRARKWASQQKDEKVACQLSVVYIEMLLEFCSFGEPMLAFTAELVGNRSLGLLDTLMSTECFLPKRCVNSLHELLYKLLGDTNFKHTFAQTFILHYPFYLRETIKEDAAAAGTSSRSKHRDPAVVNSFSVQIFTVPTLTPKLVMEAGLLDMLLETLKEFFCACVGDYGRISVSKGPVVKRLYFRIIEDIRYVMTHLEVSQYVTQKRPELARAWLHLLAFIQGMFPHRRITSIHVEEETEDWGSAYSLEFQMACIHPLFVAGAAASSYSDARSKDDLMCDSQSYPQVATYNPKGGISSNRIVNGVGSLQYSNVGASYTGTWVADVDMYDATPTLDPTDSVTELILQQRGKKESGKAFIAEMQVPHSLLWLIAECTQVLDIWLGVDASRESVKSGQLATDASQVAGIRRSTRWRGRGGRGIRDSPTQTTGGQIREWLRRSRRLPLEPRVWPEVAPEQAAMGTNSGIQVSDMDVEIQIPREGWDNRAAEWWMGPEASTSSTIGQLVEDDEWPTIEFDVSRQDVSFHIPLHRMLALLLHKTLEFYSAKQDTPSSKERIMPNFGSVDDGRLFLEQVLPPKFRVPGFAAVVMEHPLRLQVLCAQVQVGMWRRNGHATSALCDLYHTVHWCEDSLELDVFLLQCCAVLAPCEAFVERIVARFSLSDYFTLSVYRLNEYQVTLAQELLILLIRIVSERGFCGLTEKQSLRRELVQRLAVGDATRSYLLKALPPRLQDSKHLQECLNAVATYRNPSGMQQGKYVLREDCWRELDLYHPRWSPRELQLAEERYLRACRAPAVFLQLPHWSQPLAALRGLGQLITSPSVHDMLRCIFFHAVYTEDPSNSRAPEELLLHALHLLALALDVCKSQIKVGGESKADIDFSLRDLNTSSSNHVENLPPLLLRSIERVAVGRADLSIMPEHQSMLSLLVLLLRKRDRDGAGEAGSYGFGDLIKKLLRSFAELNRACMYEIESLDPEILHRVSVSATLKIGRAGEINFKDDISVSESDRRRAIARERQAAAMAKMKAAQDMFVINYKTTEESNCSGKGDETEAKRPKESGGGSDESSEDIQVTHCALCRDAASNSPLCFMVLIQRSKLLAVAEKPTPSWKHSIVTLAEHVERESEASDGVNTAAGLGPDDTRYFHSTAELLRWIQDAIGDTQTRTRLLDGEDLLELIRNGPGIRNPLRVTPEFLLNWDVTAIPADTELEEIKSGSEIICTENSNEVGTNEATGSMDVNWWEDNYSKADQGESSTNRDKAMATVLAEYVATAFCRGQSRPQERTRYGRNEFPRHAVPEIGREGVTRSRRGPSRISLAMSEATRYKSNDTVGIHMSACGHAMHQECCDRYFSSLLQRSYSRALFEGVQIVDLDMGEFLCPVCRRLANAILPVLPGQTGLSSSFKAPSVAQLSPSVSSSSAILQVDHALRLLVKAEELVSRSEFRKVADPQLPQNVNVVLEDLAKRLYGLFYAEKGLFISPSSVQGHVHQGLLLWNVFKYSLISAELAARSQKFLEGTGNSLIALVEMGESSHGSVLPLLLHAAKATQSQSRQAVLLRARGMQLSLDTIVNGVSRDMHSNGVPTGLLGNYSSLLQYLEKDNDSVDVQLWKRLADPILVHDAFSSFTWLLFCLPLPFPANGAPFSALVHLFYLVTIIQIVAQLGSFAASSTELTPSARSLITAVQRGLTGTVLEHSSGDSNVPPGSILVYIRRCTLPFLRRCYLLQNLMSGNTQVLPVATAHQWELSQSQRQSTGAGSVSGDTKYAGEQVLLEIEQLDQLEKIFLIPSLGKIFEQDTVQQLVQVWCKHVKSDSEPRGIQYSPRVTTASPFRLMQLPHLFQDLMQRYVKERCPLCKTVPDKPAICLLCGALCCAVSSRLCCR
uniref:E3 ubiquitin-protein ligase n=1 Tax=Physcomitrium patens TaxID=3218 RepID=A0A7I4DB25_PHYPA